MQFKAMSLLFTPSDNWSKVSAERCKTELEERAFAFSYGLCTYGLYSYGLCKPSWRNAHSHTSTFLRAHSPTRAMCQALEPPIMPMMIEVETPQDAEAAVVRLLHCVCARARARALRACKVQVLIRRVNSCCHLCNTATE